MDRRAVFFVCAAAVCAALIPLIPVEKGKPDITWVGWVTCGAFLVLAALSFLDHRSRRRAED
jgi:hypothetical protein